jgi:ABC-type polysaccharide/polyol phosphate export permease
MYNFWVQVWAHYKGLYDWLHPRGYIANVIIYPIVVILMYSVLGRYALDPAAAAFFTIGMTVSLMTYNIISAITMSYANDRWYSTLTFLYVSKANRFLNYLSRCILHYPTGLVVFITSMVMIKLTTSVDFGLVNWLGLIVAVLVLNASLCAFSQFLGIFSIILTEWLNTLAFSLGISFILSGIIVPLDVFPQGVQEFAKILPVTNGLIAIRAAFSGAALSAFYFDIIREALTSAVYFAAGYYCFLLFERVVKRSGKLEMEQYG